MGLVDVVLLGCTVLVFALTFGLIVLTLGLLVLCTKACVLERFDTPDTVPRADGNIYSFDSIIEGDRTYESRVACDAVGSSYELWREGDDDRCITAATDPRFEYSNTAFDEAMKSWSKLIPATVSGLASELSTVAEDAVTAAVATGALETPEYRIREFILDKLNNEPSLSIPNTEFEVDGLKIITELPAVQVTAEVVVHRPTLAQGKHLLLDLFMGPFEVHLMDGRVLGVVNMSRMKNEYDDSEETYAAAE